ncbi:transcriptional regulator [Glutamicibacter protophormiae]|uniref:transcriptional regulator n=1 Tax=Glutamicibacter protophormiae TaxID=37930 RepID=UPI002A8340A7|nr:transcriptional regulator [Glutamicibacter protophormiae]WPR65117.1 transcriptional regulator [Glutamicibacter protophormiae]WPR68614.1 transcriptional regulator [Glutamicibacter protophormiae]
MPDPAIFNELIHAPIRLRICASLAPVQWAEFSHLRENLGITDSVLSKHLKQLTDAGYVGRSNASPSSAAATCASA